MSKEEVFIKLKELISEMLGIEADEISMESVLVGDLGMESIDMLDLTFQLEEKFGVHVDPAEFSGRASPGDNIFAEDGRTFTENGLEVIKKHLPQIPEDNFYKGLTSLELPSLLTVEVFVDLVLEKGAKAGDKVEC
ncbi:acyl carrier protein [Candidatus Riflebacteria bacterium]